jgi:hypothetical protein
VLEDPLEQLGFRLLEGAACARHQGSDAAALGRVLAALGAAGLALGLAGLVLGRRANRIDVRLGNREARRLGTKAVLDCGFADEMAEVLVAFLRGMRGISAPRHTVVK